MSQQHEFDPSIPHYGCHACNAEKLPEPVKVTTATPEPSVRALTRYHLKGRYGGNIEWSEHEAGEWVRSEDLAAHFAKLADLAAEMQRFADYWQAEAMQVPMKDYDRRSAYHARWECAKQALAWAARLQELQQ